jgi:hypothetical protein
MRHALRGRANAVNSEYLQQPKKTRKNSATVNLFSFINFLFFVLAGVSN